jgi:hypothetical protein
MSEVRNAYMPDAESMDDQLIPPWKVEGLRTVNHRFDTIQLVIGFSILHQLLLPARVDVATYEQVKARIWNRNLSFW